MSSARKQLSDNSSSARSNRAGGSNRQANVASEPNADKLFEPSVEMMVNDFDDERTLEEEEALAASEAEDPNAELSNLQREGDMPIEELLALYNCVPPHMPSTSLSSESTSKRSSRRARSSSAIQPENTPSVPDPLPPSTEVESTSCSEQKSDAPIKIASDETDADVPDAKSADQEKSSIVTPNSEKIGIDTLDGPATKTTSEETQLKIDGPEEGRVPGECTTKPDRGDDGDRQSGHSLRDCPPESKTKSCLKCASDEHTYRDCPQEGDTFAHAEFASKELTEMDEGDDDDEEEDESELRKLYPETFKTNEPRILRATSRPNSDEEEEEGEDIDYSPEEDEFKKKIMVGSEFQAQIPEGLCRYDDALPYENEDKLVWDPSQLNECDIELYLRNVNIPVNASGGAGTNATSTPANSSSSGTGTSNSTSPLASNSTASGTTAANNKSVLPCGNHLRDDEQSLYLLLQCGHNMEEALRRRRLNATLPPVVAVAAATTASHPSPDNDTRMSLWSEEECRNFESGLRIYGKDFHAIQQAKVRTRSVSELVQFYYLWKKTERHDIFANKARLEKKKYSLHPGLTDYMDRFLEEQENNGVSGNTSASNAANIMGTVSANVNSNGNTEHGIRDRSLSPVVNCLLFTDYKRQRLSQSDVGSTLPIISPTTSSSANAAKLMSPSANATVTTANDCKSMHHSGKL